MKAKKIMICDDDEGILDVATIILQSSGFEVIGLLHSEKVLEVIKKERPDLILLDLWMPKMNGSRITKELKKDLQTSHIPIIIVSANKDIEAVTKKIGADGFLAKPFDLDELFTVVRKYLD